jgi:hypothetical protein
MSDNIPTTNQAHTGYTRRDCGPSSNGCGVTPAWEEYLGLVDDREWIALVSDYTPAHVKEILGREEAPSWEDLLGIGWTETRDAVNVIVGASGFLSHLLRVSARLRHLLEKPFIRWLSGYDEGAKSIASCQCVP